MTMFVRLTAAAVLVSLLAGCAANVSPAKETDLQRQSLRTLDQADQKGSRAE